jgi:hypothetical protein
LPRDECGICRFMVFAGGFDYDRCRGFAWAKGVGLVNLPRGRGARGWRGVPAAGRFAHAARRSTTGDDMRLDGRCFAHAQHAQVVEIRLLDAPALERYRAPQHTVAKNTGSRLARMLLRSTHHSSAKTV